MTTTSHHYCVPTALSILTGLPIENIEAELKLTYLGDIEISGIYIGLALKFLSDNGYHWTPLQAEGTRLISVFLKEPSKYLIEIKGHALIYSSNSGSKDNKIYDNSYPVGIDIFEYPRRAERIVRAYRITRDPKLSWPGYKTATDF